jgi:Putative addiction module component
MAGVEDHIRELLKLSPDERARAARVLLDSLDEGGPSADELRGAWTAWLVRGPQGPIEDDEEDDGASASP